MGLYLIIEFEIDKGTFIWSILGNQHNIVSILFWSDFDLICFIISTETIIFEINLNNNYSISNNIIV